jgi:hypothetical protein
VEDGYTKKDRYNPETERTLRQWLNVDGPKGATDAYRLRHAYTFDFTAEERAEVDQLVEGGMLLEIAIARVGGKKADP